MQPGVAELPVVDGVQTLTLAGDLITVTITTPAAPTTNATTNVVVDGLTHSTILLIPQLASFDLRKAKIDWRKQRIKVRAKLTLPAGTALAEIVPTAEVLAIAGGTDGVTVSETVTLTAHGDKWEFRSNDATSQVKKLKLNWHGGEFRYDGVLGLKLGHMGQDSTSLEIDPKGNKTFTIEIAGRTIHVDPSGVAAPADVEVDRDDDDELELEFPEALNPESIFTITVPDQAPITIRLGDHLTQTTAKIEAELRFPAGTSVDPSTLPKTFQLHLGLGAEPYSGAATIAPTGWTKTSPKEWKLKRKD